MNKAFTLWYWLNYPSEETPLSEEFLNRINVGLDTVDNRVISLNSTKANQTDLLTAVADVTFDESTGIFTVTKKNGSVKRLDTKLEKLAVNFEYDSTNQRLVLTLSDGTIQYVDLKALITELEFLDSNTVLFSVTDGKVTANIAKGSITGDMLEPNYLANVEMYSSQALESAQNAKESEEKAKISEDNAKDSEAVAVEKATSASVSEENAKNYAEQAKNSADRASASEVITVEKAVSAEESARNAKESETNAKQSELNVKESEVNAKESEDNADISEEQARQYAEQAKALNDSTSDLLDQINRKIELAEFDIDDDGNLIYTDNTTYLFTVDDDGNLNWEVAE